MVRCVVGIAAEVEACPMVMRNMPVIDLYHCVLITVMVAVL